MNTRNSTSRVKQTKTNQRNKGYGTLGSRATPSISKKEVSVWDRIKAQEMKEREAAKKKKKK